MLPRLIGIVYPGESGRATGMTYDAFGRRTATTNTPAGGGSAVTTLYTRCGSVICQARDAGDIRQSVQRRIPYPQL
ncbi:hypothetical protein [Mesorhizobium sp. M0018]|uniref:hypothetical protein n=1 Tax=Mesorhizobium sp. M0018 TaxID=2956844 RepID=UPI003334E179